MRKLLVILALTGILGPTLAATSLASLMARAPTAARTAVVTSPEDRGLGTLREALESAQPGDLITFDPAVFPPAHPLTITVQSDLPRITADSLTIDASDAGVILNGTGWDPSYGLVVDGANGVVIRGLQIVNFERHGIMLTGRASQVTIGGDRSVGAGPLGQGNLISGNRTGIWVEGADAVDNQVLGNYIGTDITGLQAFGNRGTGVLVSGGAIRTVIGDNTSSTRNVISGNDGDGVWLNGVTSGNRVIGNYIGTDAIGTRSLRNAGSGVAITWSAIGNTIGGEGDGEGNLISSNLQSGVRLEGYSTDNRIVGNLVGTDLTGTQVLANGGDGILIMAGSARNIIGGAQLAARNVISGNSDAGVRIQDAETNSNQIVGNYIGTDTTGSQKLGNGSAGIVIQSSSSNAIGGTNSGEGNVISGNAGAGIYVEGVANSNQLLGNYIGTDSDGQTPLGNGWYGIFVGVGSHHNIIGDGTEQGRNLVSANLGTGIVLSNAAHNQIEGNYIGTNIDGSRALGNRNGGVSLEAGASDNIVGGTDPGHGNLISGNYGTGVLITGATTINNLVQGNSIGTDAWRATALPNAIGVVIEDATDSIIGGPADASGNVIAFNRSAGLVVRDGVRNLLQRNSIQDNDGLAVQTPPGNRLVENSISGNQPNIVQVVSKAPITANENWTPQGDLDTYFVVAGDLIVPATHTWNIAPGVDVWFDFGLGAQIAGAMKAQGEAQEPIRFTSAQRFAAPLPGDWLGLSFMPGSSGTLRNASLEFATNGIAQEGGTLQVMSSTIAASKHAGIVARGGSLTLAESNLAGNGEAAIDNQSDHPISATGTWWGSATGPSTVANPGGRGDVVRGDVDVFGWRSDPGPKNTWQSAPVLDPGTHRFTISDERDLQWFRVPVGTRNAVITATLTALPQDYDAFLFSGLERAASWPGGIGNLQDIGNVQDIGNLQDIPGSEGQGGACAPAYLGQVADAAQAADLGSLLRASCAAGTDPETVAAQVWNQSGWYHLLVSGHNGANAPEAAYTMAITVTPGVPVAEIGFQPPVFDPPGATYPLTKTLILTNGARLRARYGSERTEMLLRKVATLAASTEVAGAVIDLGSDRQLADVYSQWDQHRDSLAYANLVAASVKALLATIRPAYPALENIQIVGDDEVLPFRRIPDETPLANESEYDAALAADTPVGASLREAYFLSDDYYASFNPVAWRGRALNLPDYSVSRLVETPEEMAAAIDVFLQQPVLAARTGLAVGYDFLKDQAHAVAREMESADLDTDTSLIGDSWQADALRAKWLENSHDLNSINAHFEHWRAIPAERAGGEVTAADVQASDRISGTLVFSVGCHSGLPVPDEQATTNRLDFAQALVGRGAAYIANTGYGYGDADAIGYSERLMVLFTRFLSEGASVGQALRQAKAQYLASVGIHALTPYDEKALAVATLYGLGMYRVEMPGASPVVAATAPTGANLVLAPTCPVGLTCRQVTLVPVYQGHSSQVEGVTGTYFSIADEVQIVPGQPKQPRTSAIVTLEAGLARGALFEGGRFETLSLFDPVVTTVRSDGSASSPPEVEPSYAVTAWTPSQWHTLNTQRTPGGAQQQLVVVPAQYAALTAQIGVERRFTEITYTIYYSDTQDTLPPSIWSVRAARVVENETKLLTVNVTDFSRIVRVVASYTLGDGEWLTTDLMPDTGHPDRWIGTLPNRPDLTYFVQAVDAAGNVAIANNRGRYFVLTYRQYFPLIRTSELEQ